MSALQRTALHELHCSRGARLCPFAGFEMPLHYASGARAEHLHTREGAGLFDVSHMGQVRARGAGLLAALERVLPVDFDGWPDAAQRYSLLPNDAGGIEDDMMLARYDDEVRLVVNAARRQTDLEILRARCPELSFELLDASLLALQGPAAERVLATVQPAVAELPFMHTGWYRLGDVECLVARSGYTGEDGFEISVPSEGAGRLARRLLEHPDVKLVGLAARDTLRLEAGLPLHGQDIGPQTTIVEAGLGWAVARSRRSQGAKQGGFPGAEVFLRQSAAGAGRRIVGLLGEEAIPVRQGASLLDDGAREIGRVTSGTVSPSTRRAVMLAYLDATFSVGSRVFAAVRGKPRRVHVVPLPFVEKRYKR
jgi:aminomethyltransferase